MLIRKISLCLITVTIWLLSISITFAAGGEGHGGIINISWQILLVQLVTFLLLLLILGKFLFKPITNLLENRSNQIKNTLDTIASEKQDIEKIKQDYQNQLTDLSKKAIQITQEAAKEGEIQRQKIIAQSQVDANKILERAEAVIAKEKEKAILELKTQTADLSILAASKILERTIDESMAHQLIDKFIEDVDKKTLH